MKPHSKFALVSTLTLGLSLCAVADLGKAADIITLKLKPGQAVRYKTVSESSTDMMGSSFQNKATTVSKAEVLSTSEGWTKIRVSNELFESSGDSQPGEEMMLDAMKDLVMTFEVNDRGLARNAKMENTDDLDPMILETVEGSAKAISFFGFMGIHYPSTPIETGSEWKIKLKGSDMFSDGGVFESVDGDIHVNFAVLGFESIKNKRHAKIESKIEGDLELSISSPAGNIDASMTMESTTMHWVELETGLVLKSTSEGTTTTDFGVGTMEQEIKTTIQRLDRAAIRHPLRTRG